jgi:hypothetical protein
MTTVFLQASNWSYTDLHNWFVQRGLTVDLDDLARNGKAAVALTHGLWPRALVPVQSFRIGHCRVLRATATEYRQMYAYFIEVGRERETWRISLKRDPWWIQTMLGWGAGGTIVLSVPLAAVLCASGPVPKWLEPWWRLALLELALAGLAALPSLLILQWLREGISSRRAYEAVLQELKSANDVAHRSPTATM